MERFITRAVCICSMITTLLVTMVNNAPVENSPGRDIGTRNVFSGKTSADIETLEQGVDIGGNLRTTLKVMSRNAMHRDAKLQAHEMALEFLYSKIYTELKKTVSNLTDSWLKTRQIFEHRLVAGPSYSRIKNPTSPPLHLMKDKMLNSNEMVPTEEKVVIASPNDENSDDGGNTQGNTFSKRPPATEDVIDVIELEYPRHCVDYLLQYDDPSSGIYVIFIGRTLQPLAAYCDMESDKGTGRGWLTFLRRYDGSENFNRVWMDYELGFGDIGGEFWLGNQYLYKLTTITRFQLRIELEDFDGNRRYAEYTRFRVGPPPEYRLTIGAFQDGDAGDGLLPSHNNTAFSTTDRDQDLNPRSNCARGWKCGWWFSTCFFSNLNGVYRYEGETGPWRGIVWGSWQGETYSFRRAEMMIRPMD